MPIDLDQHEDGPRVDPSKVDAIQRELRELPALRPPAAVWSRVAAEVGSTPPSTAQASPARFARLALAASVAMVTTMAVFFAFDGSLEGEGAQTANSPWVANGVPSAEIAHLLERSRNAETIRRSFPPNAQLVADQSVPDAYAPRILRGRIADVDATMNRLAVTDGMSAGEFAEQRERLLRRRVELMESLVEIEQERLKASLQRVTY